MLGYCDPFIAMNRAKGTCECEGRARVSWVPSHERRTSDDKQDVAVSKTAYSEIVTKGAKFSTLVLKVVDEL
jgi:hypothetical protein